MSTVTLKTEGLGVTILLGILAAMPALSIDINASTFLTVQHDLAARPGLVGLTISLFMVGFALGQLGAGPISDRCGRRPVLLTSLVFYTIAAIGCAMSPTIYLLIAWRLLQGVGAGGCAVLAFTIIHDLFQGDTARSKRSYVTVVFGLAPMLAPSAGAWVLDRFGWRPIFVILALTGIAILIAAGLGLAESRKPSVTPMSPASIGRVYARLMRDRRFLELAIVNALSFSAMFAYIAGSPLVLMGSFHLSAPNYGIVFASTATALTAGAWISGRCASAGLSTRRLLSYSLAITALAPIMLTLHGMVNEASLWITVPGLLVSLFGRGIIAPSAQHLALEPIQADQGSAAAAVGVSQILMGAVSSALVVALIPPLGPLAMSGVMALMALASWGLWLRISTAPARNESRSTVAVAESGL